ncbi:uncharacterized protein VTP21DRAFT_4258 [Calcarisporiella thermophila]|uniref:uncharacterized protein n=1 Tax=Calcarisporiella thermophila TaxID=911321 RepID=UPI0037445EFD
MTEAQQRDSPNTMPGTPGDLLVAAAAPVDEDLPIIREDQYVFIQMPSGNVKVVSLRKNTTVGLGKFGSFQVNDVLGKPFGHTYEIYGKDKVRIVKRSELQEVEETGANNRDITDDGTAQKLTREEIEALKQEGLMGELEGQEIIKRMVEGNTSFEKRTEFSKAKYIMRKEKKYMKTFTPVKPTLYSVCDYFFKKNPGKIRDIRIDTLAQLLSFANVHAHSKLLVVDDTQGMVLAGVAERMGGYGSILAIHDGEFPNYDVLRYMNFSQSVLDTIKMLSWAKVRKDDDEKPFEYKDESTLDNRELSGYKRRKLAYEKLQTARELLWSGEFDGLVIASQFTPESILAELLPFVSGSRPIVVYSPYKETLLDAVVWMRKSPSCLNPQITESWLRPYQVLPGRTHPAMMTSGHGGYLLTATRVIDCAGEPAFVGKRKQEEMQQKKQNESEEEAMKVDSAEDDERRSEADGSTDLDNGASKRKKVDE